MARRRTHPSRTPFGAWLEEWLRSNPDLTHQALADDLGVSKGLISQWTAGDVRSVSAPNLQAVARRTGADLGMLEQMVYGESSRPAATLDPAVAAEIHAAVAEEVAKMGEEIQALVRELFAGSSR